MIIDSDICNVDIYKVSIEDNTVVSAMLADNLQHGDIGISEDNKTLEWLALESPDEKTAIEIAGLVVRTVWKK